MTQGSNYSPFDKPLSEVVGSDLASLNTTKEGWYVEYKRELPNANTIAKSVSAFANTYGGWLFVGVEEKSKEDPVAGAFPGIADADVDGALQCIRQAIATHLSAAPLVETAVVAGPSPEIGLPAGRSVICVRTPWSANAPFVHSSGRIYRRVSDGSEPRPETDRHLLDQLWRRGDELKDQYREWIERDPEFSEEEQKIPYVRILLVPDPWRERNPCLDLSLRQMRDLFAGTSDLSRVALPFDTVHQVTDGFIARQAANNDPTTLTMTWRLWRDLVSEVIIPLNLFEGRPSQIFENLTEYDHAREFCTILREAGCQSARLVDVNFLFRIIFGVVELQNAILTKAGWTEGYHMKARVLNAWRTIPFLDTAYFIKDCKVGGLPLCLKSIVTAPGGTDPDSFVDLTGDDFTKQEVIAAEVAADGDMGATDATAMHNNGQDAEAGDAKLENARSDDSNAADDREFKQRLSQAIGLFIPIAQALGVTIVVDTDEVVDIADLYAAGQRAFRNQAARNARLKASQTPG